MELNKIYHGHCLEVLKTLPSETVNTVVTSPPYWGLRNYGVDGQIGLENSVEEYVSALVEVFRQIKRILKALSKTGLKVRELKTPQDETDWNNRQIDILLAHPASAAYGLNLQQGGNHVVWFGLNWSLELYQQANKRLHRQGQTEKVIIHHLTVTGGVDEDVISALLDKSSTQDHLMNALKARIEKVKAE